MVVFTKEKETRPWIGRVYSILGADKFKIHWFSNVGSKNIFSAMYNRDKSPYLSTVDNDSVILWGFTEPISEDKFRVRSVMLEQIKSSYSYHDTCYI